MERKEFLKTIDQKLIFEKLGIVFSWGKFTSPFRKDNNPSANFFINDDGIVLIRDWSMGVFDVIDTIGFLFSITSEEEIRTKIKKFEISSIMSYPRTKLNEIRFISTDFNEYDEDFWESWKVRISTVQKCNIKRCAEVWLNIRDNWYFYYNYSAVDPVYAYQSYYGTHVYFPSRKRSQKWRSNTNLIGLELIEECDNLIITKSLKDWVCLKQLGFESIAFTGETKIPTSDQLKLIKKRSKNQIVIYDNDPVGQRMGTKVAQILGCTSIIPDKKDVAEEMANSLSLCKKIKSKFWLPTSRHHLISPASGV